MSNYWSVEGLCVKTRRSIHHTIDRIKHCEARTTHERERIAVWAAFRGRWQLPMDVFIMKEIETALFSPLRGDGPMPAEVSYMEILEIVRTDMGTACHTSDERMDYLARLLGDLEIMEGVRRRSLDELARADRLCSCLDRQLGLVLDAAP